MKEKFPLVHLFILMLLVATLCQGYLCVSGTWTSSVDGEWPILQQTVLSAEHDLVSYAIDWARLLVNHLF